MAWRHSSNRPFVLGITGGIAAGKSTVCRMLSAMGVAVWDADRAAKSLYRTDRDLLESVIKHFGPELGLQNGEGDIVDVDLSLIHI